MNSKGFTEKVKNRIEALPCGSVFVTNDFSDITDIDTIRQILQRLAQDGSIKRVMNGTYTLSSISTLIDVEIPPDPNEVAYAIARAHCWNITPSETTALNVLGLSPQVPTVWSYTSDGSYRQYSYGNTEILFKHSAKRNLDGMSPVTQQVVQALKGIGSDRMTSDIVALVASRLSASEKSALVSETMRTAGWIQKSVRLIAENREER